MSTQNQTQQEPKKSYIRPQLINYGDVRSLTKAGTKVGNENTHGGEKNKN